MAHRKAGGSADNLRDSNAQYLGLKKNDNQPITTGQVIIRQRGTKYMAGENVKVGKDHTLFAMTDGRVKFTDKRKVSFNGKTTTRKLVSVI
jgi:large subunit ribosomal protein L27